MPKIVRIEYSSEESGRMVEQLKDIISDYEYRSLCRSGTVYEFGSLRIDQPKREVTLNGDAIKLTRKEFEILVLFASHPDEALPCDFLHNVIWLHPDAEHGEEEVAAHVRSLREKLKLAESGSDCRIMNEDTQRGKGYRFITSAV